MRDPNRIIKFCNELAVIWAENVPDWRFGQFMMNILGRVASEGKDPFFLEEDELMNYIKEYFGVK